MPVGVADDLRWCGRIRHALKPKVKTTGFGNVMAAPHAERVVAVNHGNGLSLFCVVEYVQARRRRRG